MHKTRESWLNHLAQLLTPAFARAGHSLPSNIRMSCGWPGSGCRSNHGGECWHSQASADGSFEIFISPLISDPIEVSHIFVHELCHTAVGPAAGHGRLFKRCALALGLTGPMRSTVASPALQTLLQGFQAALGPYPHATLSPGDRPTKKDGTRLLKVVCPECGYTVRTTAKWIAVGPPVCPCGQTMEQETEEE